VKVGRARVKCDAEGTGYNGNGVVERVNRLKNIESVDVLLFAEYLLS